VVVKKTSGKQESTEDAVTTKEELKKELRAELKAELTKEILQEQRSQEQVASAKPRAAAIVKQSAAAVAKSHEKVAVKRHVPAAKLEAKPTAARPQQSKVLPSVHAQTQTTVQHHAAPLAAAENWFDVAPKPLQNKAVPATVAVENWLGNAPSVTAPRASKARTALAATAQVTELKAELASESRFRQEAAAEAASETGVSASVWNPKLTVANADQVAELKAELSQERKFRESAAEAAEVAKTSASPPVVVAKPQPSTTQAPVAARAAPARRPVLPWQHQASADPVMGVVDPAQHGTIQGSAPAGLFAWIRNGFAAVTGGRLSWLFAANAPAVVPPQPAMTTTTPTQKTALRLLATRKQDYAKVAARTRNDQLHNLDLGSTWQVMEDEDSSSIEELNHEDVYARSTANQADQPHVLTEKERLARSKEQVHISDVWSNLEKQDQDIEASIDAMGADANLNSYGALDSIQDKSMASLTREVNAADEAPKTQRPVMSHHDDSPEAKMLHETFEEMQTADEEKEHNIHLDVNMRRE